MPRESRVQYYVWHKGRKILKGPFLIVNAPRWLRDEFVKQTIDAYGDGDPLRADPGWIGGTLDQILRDREVDRFDVARALLR